MTIITYRNRVGAAAKGVAAAPSATLAELQAALAAGSGASLSGKHVEADDLVAVSSALGLPAPVSGKTMAELGVPVAVGQLASLRLRDGVNQSGIYRGTTGKDAGGKDVITWEIFSDQDASDYYRIYGSYNVTDLTALYIPEFNEAGTAVQNATLIFKNSIPQREFIFVYAEAWANVTLSCDPGMAFSYTNENGAGLVSFYRDGNQIYCYQTPDITELVYFSGQGVRMGSVEMAPKGAVFGFSSDVTGRGLIPAVTSFIGGRQSDVGAWVENPNDSFGSNLPAGALQVGSPKVPMSGTSTIIGTRFISKFTFRIADSFSGQLVYRLMLNGQKTEIMNARKIVSGLAADTDVSFDFNPPLLLLDGQTVNYEVIDYSTAKPVLSYLGVLGTPWRRWDTIGAVFTGMSLRNKWIEAKGVVNAKDGDEIVVYKAGIVYIPDGVGLFNIRLIPAKGETWATITDPAWLKFPAGATFDAVPRAGAEEIVVVRNGDNTSYSVGTSSAALISLSDRIGALEGATTVIRDRNPTTSDVYVKDTVWRSTEFGLTDPAEWTSQGDGTWIEKHRVKAVKLRLTIAGVRSSYTVGSGLVFFDRDGTNYDNSLFTVGSSSGFASVPAAGSEWTSSSSFAPSVNTTAWVDFNIDNIDDAVWKGIGGVSLSTRTDAISTDMRNLAVYYDNGFIKTVTWNSWGTGVRRMTAVMKLGSRDAGVGAPVVELTKAQAEDQTGTTFGRVSGLRLKQAFDVGIAGYTPPAIVGATDTAAGKAGTAPAPSAGDNVKFLKGDGTWSTVPANGSLIGTYTPSAALPVGTGHAPGDYYIVATDGTAGNPFSGVTLKAGDEVVAMKLNASVAADWYVRARYATVPAMVGATASVNGAAGLVPAPVVADVAKVLSGAGTWVSLPSAASVMTGATASAGGAAGLVPSSLTGDQAKVLSAAGTWVSQPDLTDYAKTAALADYAKTADLPTAAKPGIWARKEDLAPFIAPHDIDGYYDMAQTVLADNGGLYLVLNDQRPAKTKPQADPANYEFIRWAVPLSRLVLTSSGTKTGALGGVTFTINSGDPWTLTTSVAATGTLMALINATGSGVAFDHWVTSTTGGSTNILLRGLAWANTTSGNIGLVSTSYVSTCNGILTSNGHVYRITAESHGTSGTVVIDMVS